MGDRNLRKAALVIAWIGSLPIRLLFCAIAFPFTLLAIPVWLLMDLDEWGHWKSKPTWRHWGFIAIPKGLYWDFLIKGRIDL